MSLAPARQWSALLPLAMSMAARLWWLLMGAQVPIVAQFAIRWLPQPPRTAQLVLALQGAAVLAKGAAVRYFNL